MIVKRAAQADDADAGLRRYSFGARPGVEERRMLVAIASLGLENFERVGNAYRRLFGDFLINPVFDLHCGSIRVSLAVENFRCQRTDARMIGLQKRRRL